MEEDHGDKTSEEISAVQYVVFATYHKEIRNRKNKKKQECTSKFSQQKIYINPGKKKTVQFHTQQTKKKLCKHLRHQDAQATEAIGDGTASIVLKGDARCFHPLID